MAVTRTGNSVISEYWLLHPDESAGLTFCAQEPNSAPPKFNFDTPKLNYQPLKERKVKNSKAQYTNQPTAKRSARKRSSYCNFKQHDYDFAAMEQQEMESLQRLYGEATD